MAVIESPIFPFCVSFGARFGPQFETDVVITDGGQEWRTVNRSQPRLRASVSLRSLDNQMAVMRQWMYVAQGRARAFRVKDALDYKVPDNAGTGGTTFIDSLSAGDRYQLQKWYTRGDEVFKRDIIKPTVNGPGVTRLFDVTSSGSTELILHTDFEVDQSTGIVTVDAAPDGDLTWVGTFEVLMRFDVDDQQWAVINRNLAADEFIQGMDDIPLVEVLFP